MGTVIGDQAQTLAASVLLGMALALFSDLLRAVRRRAGHALTGALDALFCAALTFSALMFALRFGGGELRLYSIAAAIAGAAAEPSGRLQRQTQQSEQLKECSRPEVPQRAQQRGKQRKKQHRAHDGGKNAV